MSPFLMSLHFTRLSYFRILFKKLISSGSDLKMNYSLNKTNAASLSMIKMNLKRSNARPSCRACWSCVCPRKKLIGSKLILKPQSTYILQHQRSYQTNKSCSACERMLPTYMHCWRQRKQLRGIILTW